MKNHLLCGPMKEQLRKILNVPYGVQLYRAEMKTVQNKWHSKCERGVELK